jgi:predicted nuclease with TOPRIM domain
VTDRMRSGDAELRPLERNIRAERLGQALQRMAGELVDAREQIKRLRKENARLKALVEHPPRDGM